MRVMTERSPKLDHLVLPVSDLDVAQTRLRALGFTVAPIGDHPFGTSNCCVYLADGTFLEPLAVNDAAAVNEAIGANNVFVDRDRTYRIKVGNEGFSAVVLATDDARRDHEEFERENVSAGPILEFTRPFVDATGKADGATFRLAFAADSSSPSFYMFTCQRIRSPRVNRAPLQEHRNGATRISSIGAETAQPKDHQAFLAKVLGEPGEQSADKISFKFDERRLIVRNAGEPGLRFVSVSFDCSDVDQLRRLLDADRIVYSGDRNTVIVPPAPGQGATFIFESKP